MPTFATSDIYCAKNLAPTKVTFRFFWVFFKRVPTRPSRHSVLPPPPVVFLGGLHAIPTNQFLSTTGFHARAGGRTIPDG